MSKLKLKTIRADRNAKKLLKSVMKNTWITVKV